MTQLILHTNALLETPYRFGAASKELSQRDLRSLCTITAMVSKLGIALPLLYLEGGRWCTCGASYDTTAMSLGNPPKWTNNLLERRVSLRVSRLTNRLLCLPSCALDALAKDAKHQQPPLS